MVTKTTKRVVPSRNRTGHYKAASCVTIFLFFLCVQGMRSYFGSDSGEAVAPIRPRDSMVRKLLQLSTDAPDEECDDEADCRDVHNLGSNATDQDRCDFVMATCDCGADEGLLEYNQWVFCPMGHLRGLAMTILAIWLIFVFVALAVTADDYFCPSLVVISKVLRLSPNVAGVTFLAFGNGAPDLFSAIAALEGGGDPALGLGGLLGAGVFVTTVVVGVIAVIKPFKAMERPFMRDAIFYLCGIYWTFFVLWKGRIYLGEAIGYLCFWVLYVVVVVASGSIYKKQKAAEEARLAKIKPAALANKHALESDTDYTAPAQPGMKKSDTALSIDGMVNQGFDGPTDIGNVNFDLAPSTPTGDLSDMNTTMTTLDESFANHMNNNVGEDKKEEKEEDDEPVNYWREFGRSLVPVDLDEWPDMPHYKRAFEVFKAPFVFFINITCPVVNYEVEQNGWNKYLHCLQFFCAPTICTLLIQHGLTQIGGVFPVWALTLILGAVAAVIIFFTTKCEEPPKGHDAFGFISFLIALVWIYVVANELVSLLETFGVVLNISEAILGLTLLAWGNSIGDAISNSLMARQGFARMGFAACFGGPFFNLSLGFGIPMVISMVRTNKSFNLIRMTGVQLILTSTIMFSCVSSIIFLNITKFKVHKPYGIFLFGLYVAFLVIAILVETNVIMKGWMPG